MKKENFDEKNLTKEEKKEQNGSFKEKMSLKFRKRLIASKTRTIILVVILILIFLALNTWAQSQDWKNIDVTENKLYSVTQASKDQLSNLNDDVTIYIYGYDESSVYVDLVKQYAAFSSHIKYEIVTLESNYEIITKYSLSDYSGGVMLVLCESKDKNKILQEYDFYTYDYTSGDSIDLTEEAITNAILNVTTDDPVKIYFTTGQGEYDVTSKLSILVAYLEDQVYECDSLNVPSVSEIPEDCDILAIIDPTSDLKDDKVQMIKDYISKGGNIFFAITKKDDTEFNNLQSILDLYGVSVDEGLLYETNSSNYLSYNTQPLPQVLMPNISSSSDITSDIAVSGFNLTMPWTQKLTITDVEEENVEVTSTTLLYSSDKCYGVNDIYTQTLEDAEQNTYTIAASFSRTMTTPAVEANEETGTEAVEESSITSNLIVVGNAAFLADADYNLGLLEEPINWGANADFTLNCFASLAEQENLITVRKAANITTFTSTSLDDLVVKIIIFAVPLLIIIAGIMVWNIRRRKR